MEIKVSRILAHEDMEMLVTVSFYDETTSPHCSADVDVFIDNRDRPLSAIKADALAKARAFLEQAISALAH